MVEIGRVWSYSIGQDTAKPSQRAFAFLLEICQLLFEEPDGV